MHKETVTIGMLVLAVGLITWTTAEWHFEKREELYKERLLETTTKIHELEHELDPHGAMQADHHKGEEVDHSKMDHSAMMHEKLELIDTEWRPEVNIKAYEDPKAGYNVHLSLKNFEFAPENASTDHREGEGHAHIYVNGMKISRLYSNWVHVADPGTDAVNIRVTLNANDHSDLALSGAVIEDSVTMTKAPAEPEDTSDAEAAETIQQPEQFYPCYTSIMSKSTKPAYWHIFSKVVRIVLAAAIAYFVFMKFINPYLPWEPDPSLNPDPNHVHADFAVWINGTMLDFSDDKYMSGLSYSDESHDEESEYLHKYLHLHDNVGHVIHRHLPEYTVGDFLKSLSFSYEGDCLTTDEGTEYCGWRMMLNGEEVAVDFDYDFSDIDKIVLSHGATDDDLAAQWKDMTDDACLYSQACPWRGDPPAENCIADPAVPCVADLEDDFSN